MHSEKTQASLGDVLYNIAAAQAFVQQMTFEEFKDDLKTLYATTRALEIVCEACVRLPLEFKARHSEVAWRDIRDAGNFYRHRYDDIAPAFTWKTVRDYLPSLGDIAKAELDASRPRGSTTL